MLTVFVRPASSRGRVLYCGLNPCHSLEVDCSDGELRFSALAEDRKVVCQFRITTPPGLFRPFSLVSTTDPSGKKRYTESFFMKDESKVSSALFDPVSDSSTHSPRNGSVEEGDGGPVSHLPTSSPDPELGVVTNCDSETLWTNICAFTIHNPCSNVLCVHHPCSNLPTMVDKCSNLPSVTGPCSNLPSVKIPCSNLPSVSHTCSNLPSLSHTCSNLQPVTDLCSNFTSVTGISKVMQPVDVSTLDMPSLNSKGVASDLKNGTLMSEFSSLSVTGEADLPTDTPLTCPRRFFAGLSFPLVRFPVSPLVSGTRTCPPSPTMKQFLERRRVLPDTPLRAHCGSCGWILSGPDPIRFGRVEQCSEGLISELSENWFCHPGPAPKARAEPPSVQSLFYDTTCFYLPESTCEQLSGLVEEKGCHGCGHLLSSGGRAVSGFKPFFCDRIEFRAVAATAGCSVKGEPLSYGLEATWVSLWSMIRSAFETSPSVCKLYLHAKDIFGRETCLLLWVHPEKEPFFLVRGGCGEVPFLPQEGHPVRYLVCTSPSSPVVRLWRHDFDVDFFRVSAEAARILLHCLQLTSSLSSYNKDTCCCSKEKSTCGSKEEISCCSKEKSTCGCKEEISCCSKEKSTCGSKEKSTCGSKEKTTCGSKEETTCGSKEKSTYASQKGCSKEYWSKEARSTAGRNREESSKETATCCCRDESADGFRSALLPLSLQGTFYQ